jgi:hypothetical protein
MAIVVAYNVVYRVFGWVKQKNIRLVFNASLLRKIKGKEQRLAGKKSVFVAERQLNTFLPMKWRVTFQ